MKNQEQKQAEDRMKAFEKRDTPPIKETAEDKKERERVQKSIARIHKPLARSNRKVL